MLRLCCNSPVALGQWIAYYDQNGRGFAQPDAYTIHGGRVVLFEAKLTQSEQAEGQCMDLYVPLLRKIYGMDVVACQVFKNMRYEVRNRVDGLEAVLASPSGYWLWHWLGE